MKFSFEVNTPRKADLDVREAVRRFEESKKGVREIARELVEKRCEAVGEIEKRK